MADSRRSRGATAMEKAIERFIPDPDLIAPTARASLDLWSDANMMRTAFTLRFSPSCKLAAARFHSPYKI